MQIQFQVIGEPATQGSKKVVPIYGKSGPVLRGGRVLTRAVNDNPRLADWRQQVSAAARAAYTGPLLTGPIMLELDFVRPRPKSHFGTGRNAGRLKPSAPEHPIQRPDSVKLARAVEDALTGVVWHDDSQIVVHVIAKRWGEFFCVSVGILEIVPGPVKGC